MWLLNRDHLDWPLGLRLKATELDTISSKNHTNPTECLRDMLQ